MNTSDKGNGSSSDEDEEQAIATLISLKSMSPTVGPSNDNERLRDSDSSFFSHGNNNRNETREQNANRLSGETMSTLLVSPMFSSRASSNALPFAEELREESQISQTTSQAMNTTKQTMSTPGERASKASQQSSVRDATVFEKDFHSSTFFPSSFSPFLTPLQFRSPPCPFPSSFTNCFSTNKTSTSGQQQPNGTQRPLSGQEIDEENPSTLQQSGDVVFSEVADAVVNTSEERRSLRSSEVSKGQRKAASKENIGLTLDRPVDNATYSREEAHNSEVVRPSFWREMDEDSETVEIVANDNSNRPSSATLQLSREKSALCDAERAVSENDDEQMESGSTREGGQSSIQDETVNKMRSLLMTQDSFPSMPLERKEVGFSRAWRHGSDVEEESFSDDTVPLELLYKRSRGRSLSDSIRSSSRNVENPERKEERAVEGSRTHQEEQTANPQDKEISLLPTMMESVRCMETFSSIDAVEDQLSNSTLFTNEQNSQQEQNKAQTISRIDQSLQQTSRKGEENEIRRRLERDFHKGDFVRTNAGQFGKIMSFDVVKGMVCIQRIYTAAFARALCGEKQWQLYSRIASLPFKLQEFSKLELFRHTRLTEIISIADIETKIAIFTSQQLLDLLAKEPLCAKRLVGARRLYFMRTGVMEMQPTYNGQGGRTVSYRFGAIRKSPISPRLREVNWKWALKMSSLLSCSSESTSNDQAFRAPPSTAPSVLPSSTPLSPPSPPSPTSSPSRPSPTSPPSASSRSTMNDPLPSSPSPVSVALQPTSFPSSRVVISSEASKDQVVFPPEESKSNGSQDKKERRRIHGQETRHQAENEEERTAPPFRERKRQPRHEEDQQKTAASIDEHTRKTAQKRRKTEHVPTEIPTRQSESSQKSVFAEETGRNSSFGDEMTTFEKERRKQKRALSAVDNATSSSLTKRPKHRFSEPSRETRASLPSRRVSLPDPTTSDTALRRNSCVFQKAPKDRRAGRLLSYLEGQQCCFDGLCLYPDFEMFVEKMKIAAKFSSPFPSFVVSSETVSAAISSFKQHSLETLSAVEKGESRVLPEREQRHNRGRPSSLPLPVDTYFWTQIQSDISRMTPKQRKELWQSLPSIFRRSNVEASVVEMMAHYLALCSLLSCYERVEDDSVAFLLSLVRPTGALPMNINTKGLVVAHVKGQKLGEVHVDVEGEDNAEAVTIEEIVQKEAEEAFWEPNSPFVDVDRFGVSTEKSFRFSVVTSSKDDDSLPFLPLLRSSSFLIESAICDRSLFRDAVVPFEGRREYYLRLINHRVLSRQMTADAAVIDVYLHHFLPRYFGIANAFPKVIETAKYRFALKKRRWFSERPTAAVPSSLSTSFSVGWADGGASNTEWSCFEEIRLAFASIPSLANVDPRSFEKVTEAKLLPLETKLEYSWTKATGLERYASFLTKIGTAVKRECTIEDTFRHFYTLLFAV